MTFPFESYSQAGQDSWVYEMLEHKQGGYYLDLGCNHPTFHSNTYALEQIGWVGLLVDIVGGCEDRRGTFIMSDAASPNERLRLYYKHLPPVIDYASIDTDTALMGTFNSLPWDRITCRVITIETDVYLKGEGDRDKLRSMLRAMGYELICGDVKVAWPNPDDRNPYEDWYAFPNLVNPDMIKRFRCEGVYWREILEMK